MQPISVIGILSLLVLSFSLLAMATADATSFPTITVGANPVGVAYDSGKGEIFVTNGGSSTVSVISDSSNISPDFSVSGNPSSLSIHQGFTASSTVTVASLNGFSGLVHITVSYDMQNLLVSPKSTDVTLTASGAGSTSSFDLTISTSSNTLPSSYQVVVTGTSGTLSIQFTLYVTVTQQQDFTISASPASITALTSQTGTSTITVAPVGGFTGTVTLSASISPAAGLVCSPSPPTMYLGASQASTLSCSGSAGSYTVTVTGASGSLSHMTTVSVTVNSPSNVAQGPSTIFGLSPLVFYGLVGGVVAVLVVAGTATYLLRRPKRVGTLTPAT